MIVCIKIFRNLLLSFKKKLYKNIENTDKNFKLDLFD